MEHIHRIVIGDWSDDGHSQKEYFDFKCTHDEETVIKAYFTAIDKCKVSLHENYKPGVISVCCDFEDNKIQSEQMNALKNLGVDFSFAESEEEEGVLCCSPSDIAHLFFEMAKTQIADFNYEAVPERSPINICSGMQMGYGCFDM